MKLLIVMVLAFFSASVFADPKVCREVAWTSDKIVTVKSAMHHGTRIQFPSDLKRKPTSSNPEMWQAVGEMNQVMVKPTSKTKHGNSAVIRVFTKAGYAYDVHVTRSKKHTDQDICVKIVHDVDKFATANDELSAMAFVGPQTQKALMYQSAQHQEQISHRDRLHSDITKKAIVESLRRYRYHIYTRYMWPEKDTLIGDVYDDGRFTYIRLTRSNGGLLAIESEVGGKKEIVEADYDDAYGMYTIVGIYPEFTMKLNSQEIKIRRRGFGSKGEF